jgi:hypothetical protein
LFLVVSFEADPIFWTDHSLKQRDQLVRRDDLAVRMRRAGRDPRLARRPVDILLFHRGALL